MAKSLAVLEQEFIEATNAFRNGIYDAFIEEMLPNGFENEDSVTKEFDTENDPISWTMDDGDVHTFVSVTLSEYDGYAYRSISFETESECGGDVFDFFDLDTDLLRTLLQSLIDMK